jgi:type IV secretory pathway VirJ component
MIVYSIDILVFSSFRTPMKKYYIIIFLYIAGFLALCAGFYFLKVDRALAEPAPELWGKDIRVKSASLLHSSSARFITDAAVIFKSLPLVRKLFIDRELRDLPLVDIPAFQDSSECFAIVLSGDGGWAGLDRKLAAVLAHNGVPVVGFSTLAYFQNRRTPEESSHDLARVISRYSLKWQKQCVFLIGYSYGADVLPFMISRLPETARSKVSLTVFIGLGERVDFQFHMGINWFGLKDKKTSLPVLPEVEKLSGTDIICFYGRKESDPGCRRLDQSGAQAIPLEGGHSFHGNHKKIAEVILEEGKQNILNMKSLTPSLLRLSWVSCLHSNCLYVSGISYSYFK